MKSVLRYWPLLLAVAGTVVVAYHATRFQWHGATGTIDPAPSTGPLGSGTAVTARPEVAKGWVGWAVRNRPDGPGVSVANVYTGGPADKAGVEVGDIMKTVEGEPATRQKIAAAIRAHGPGATLEFERDKADGTSDTVFVNIERLSGIESLIETTIGTGAAALAQLQREDGLWPHFQAEPTGKPRSSVATSALACAALALAGPEGGEPAAKALETGLTALLARSGADGGLDDPADSTPHRVYANSFLVLALAQEPAKHREDLARARAWLARVQIGGGDWGWVDPLDTRYGGWSYHELGQSAFLRADVSVASWALDALAASRLPGDRVEWSRAARFLERCQNRDVLSTSPSDRAREAFFRDGGFAFTPRFSKAGSETIGDDVVVFRSYGSATADGVRGLLAVSADDFDKDGREAALAWLARAYALDRNPGFPEGEAAGWSRGIYFYWLASLARAFDAAKVDRIERGEGDVHAWPDELARMLVNAQKKGLWTSDAALMGEDSPTLSTSFALIALAAARDRVRASDGRTLQAGAAPPPPPPRLAPWKEADATVVGRGRALFQSPKVGCTGCHVDLTPTNAPSLVGVADRFLEWKRTHEAARDYLLHHLVDPDTYPGTRPSGWPTKMPHFGEASGLTDEQREALVEFLLSRSGNLPVSEAR